MDLYVFGDECHQEQRHVPETPESQEDLEGTGDFAEFQQLCQVRAKYRYLSFSHLSNQTHVILVSTEEN